MAYHQLYRGSYSSGIPERGQAGSALTGIVAAAADGTLWTLRYPESAAAVLPGNSTRETKRLYVQRIHVQYVCLTAFTTPVTAGRALRLVRGAPTSGTAVNPSGGAAYTMVHKRSDVSNETLGVGRVATTLVLTTTGITFETAPLQRVMLVGAGASGAQYDEAWRFDGIEADPIYLLPGELLAIATDAAFDAAGTFQLQVDVDAVEVIGV